MPNTAQSTRYQCFVKCLAHLIWMNKVPLGVHGQSAEPSLSHLWLPPLGRLILKHKVRITYIFSTKRGWLLVKFGHKTSVKFGYVWSQNVSVGTWLGLENITICVPKTRGISPKDDDWLSGSLLLDVILWSGLPQRIKWQPVQSPLVSNHD